jgi:hypothetical protein
MMLYHYYDYCWTTRVVQYHYDDDDERHISDDECSAFLAPYEDGTEPMTVYRSPSIWQNYRRSDFRRTVEIKR